MPPGTETSGFGRSVAALGDVDGDGYGDFAAAETIGGIVVGGGGIVSLFSDQTGSMIRTISDGAPDLIVGSPGYGADPIDNTGDPLGRAYVFSGADGFILRTLQGTVPSGDFGLVVGTRIGTAGTSTPGTIATG